MLQTLWTSSETEAPAEQPAAEPAAEAPKEDAPAATEEAKA